MTNPVPYFAPYSGFKTHLNQNEKIVLMIDGCSRLIVGYTSTPIKNPILIYEYAFHPAVLKYGVWEQVRIDHGRKFALVIFIQQVLLCYRLEGRKQPFKQIRSTENNVTERLWPDVNQAINYPVKRAMNEIIETDNTDIFDIENHTFKFCVSWFMFHITKNAIHHFANSWNCHRVPGPRGCIPFGNMIRTNRMSKIPDHLVPNTPEAASMFEEHDSQLTYSPNFAIDPLMQRGDLYESRLTLFQWNAPPPSEIYSDVIYGNFESLRESLRLFNNIALNLANNF